MLPTTFAKATAVKMWKCCRNRPLRGFATHRDANTPSEASAEYQFQLPMRGAGA